MNFFYSNYEKFLLAGDFNVEEGVTCLDDFLYVHNAKNLVKENTCYKNVENPSCIDLFLTNSYQSFYGTKALATGLSDFHKMVITIMRNTYPKSKPKIVFYRNYKNFNLEMFRRELKTRLRNSDGETLIYTKFEETFLEILEKHAPLKKRVLRANNKPFMTKALRKAIMRRSALRNKHMKLRSVDAERAYKKQRNYTNRLLKREKKKYFYNLDLNNYTDNKKFWETVKPLFSKNGRNSHRINLVDNDGEIICNDKEVAETFNNFFIDVIKSLDIAENAALQNKTGNLTNPVRVAVKRFDSHSSILEIKSKMLSGSTFSFSMISVNDVETEIDKLDGNKAGTFMNIPTKILKQVKGEIAETLKEIWNKEIIDNLKFPTKLKLADITPVHKKLGTIFRENYRPVSVLPVVSKIFERILENQMKPFVEKHLSPYLCGCRKGYNPQYALIAMIEKWKKMLVFEWWCYRGCFDGPLQGL